MHNSQLPILNFIANDTETFGSQFSILNSQLRVETLASSSWFGALILFILIAIALSLSAHRRQYTLYVRNLLNTQGRVMNYDTESTSGWANVLLWICIVSIYALLINVFLNLSVFNLSHTNISLSLSTFLIIFASIGGFFLLKLVTYKTLGYVFNYREVAQAFTIDYFVVVALSGIILLPLIVGLVYTLGTCDLLWLFAMAFVALFMIITLFIKLLQFFYSGIGSLFYIFLYLCTSEILPLLVATKVAYLVVFNV